MTLNPVSKSINNSMSVGQKGEETVLNHYLSQNFLLISRNFQYYRKGQSGRQGEIDLIFTKDNKLFLVEVKTRTNQKFGLAINQINATKIKNLFKTYIYFVNKFPQFKQFVVQVDIATIDSGILSITPNAITFDSF